MIGRNDRDSRVVVGVDGWTKGWVAVVLEDARFREAQVFATFAALLNEFPHAAAIGVDIPIGIPDEEARLADLDARAFLGARRSSVFLVPSREVLEAPDHATASQIHRSRTQKGISQQSYGLRTKILEVDILVGADDHVIEVHPEVSFRALADEPLTHSKKTWTGAHIRERLLANAGIEIPDTLGAASVVPTDDVLDAAAAAWSANRYAKGEAQSLPDDPPRDNRGRLVAIWF